MQQFFYDNQIRRFVLQFVRILSNFQVELGTKDDGTRTLQRVPVRFATVNRQVANILKENSASSLNTAPLISVSISGLKYDRPRMQEPTFVDKMNIRYREFDADSGTYSHRQGNTYTIERLMPVPYQLEMRADIWTSNTEQKLQLLEQMLVLFNPSLEIQSTDNYVDWTSLSYVDLTDVIYSTLPIPVGQEDAIDLASLNFSMPIWISSPAKVKRLGVIQRIVNGLYDYQGDINDVLDGEATERKAYTPLEYGIILLDGQIILLKSNHTSLEVKNSEGGLDLVKIGEPTNWTDLINLYGKLVNGVSQIRLYLDEETMVVGTVSQHPSDETILLFSVDTDTIPANNLTAVDAIIDPLKVGPGSGLAAPVSGTRYLLTQAIGHPDNQDGADAWKGTGGQDLVAGANDIIQYNGTRWVVSFNAQASTTGSYYVTNLKTGVQYKWAQGTWSRSYEGRYQGGSWSLVI